MKLSFSAGPLSVSKKPFVAAPVVLATLSLLWFAPLAVAHAQSAGAAAIPSNTPAGTPTTAAAGTTFQLISGFDPALMDTSADPCADFYQYACGNWKKLHPIPSDSPYSDQFYNLQQYNTQLLHAILEKAAVGGASRDSNTQKIGDYYSACMDREAVEKKGYAPLQPALDRIAALTSKDQLPQLFGRFSMEGISSFVEFGREIDPKDATRNVAYLAQSGIELERDYYLRTGEKDIEIRKKFTEHVAKELKLIGEPEAQATSDAAAIVKLETELAKVSLDVTSMRDPYKVYHWMSVTDLKTLTPNFKWDPYFTETGAPAFAQIDVNEPEFFKGMNRLISETSLETIKAYLRWEVATSNGGPTTPKALDDEAFDFEGRVLAGVPEQEPRWKRCTGGADARLGEALGKAYVEQQFPASSKEKSLQMIHDIEAQMDKDIDTLDWMGAATKVKAKEKMHLMTEKIGYPDKWRDYSTLEIKPDDAFGNRIRASAFERRRQLAKIGQPVDRKEWGMTPPTVNAYYSADHNDINFPAGVLQPAFFDTSVPDSFSYGHIGLFMGHEITHGFDDQGRQYDGHGNLSDWWTKEDAVKFQERADCIVDEYSQFTVADVHLNGKLTLGENTADNGGLRLAYMAYLARAAQEGVDQEKKSAGGYLPLQQFFVGFAQDWCSDWRPELERLIATTDPHSPDRFRANGVLVNMPEFASAFGCKAGQKMVAAKACRVW